VKLILGWEGGAVTKSISIHFENKEFKFSDLVIKEENGTVNLNSYKQSKSTHRWETTKDKEADEISKKYVPHTEGLLKWQL